MTQQRNPKRICSRIGLGLFAMLVFWYVGSFVAQMLIASAAPAFLDSEWSLWVINGVPMYLLGLPAFLLIVRTVPDGPVAPREKVPFGPGKYLLALVFCFGASYLVNLLVNVLILLLQAATGSEGIFSGALDELVGSGGWLPAFVFGVVVPATGEEFIFRYTIRRKMRGCADSMYIFFSGFCFALFHANLAQTLYTFFVGAVLAWAYVVTEKLWVPISLHFIVNLVGIVIVPAIAENEAASLFFGLYMFIVIAAAITIGILCHKRFFASMRPPTEAGWPYRPSRSVRQSAAYSGNVRPGDAYAAWYEAYAQQPVVAAVYNMPPQPVYPPPTGYGYGQPGQPPMAYSPPAGYVPPAPVQPQTGGNAYYRQAPVTTQPAPAPQYPVQAYPAGQYNAPVAPPLQQTYTTPQAQPPMAPTVPLYSQRPVATAYNNPPIYGGAPGGYGPPQALAGYPTYQQPAAPMLTQQQPAGYGAGSAWPGTGMPQAVQGTSGRGVALGNVGMVLFTCACTVLLLFSLIVMIL